MGPTFRLSTAARRFWFGRRDSADPIERRCGLQVLLTPVQDTSNRDRPLTSEDLIRCHRRALKSTMLIET